MTEITWQFELEVKPTVGKLKDVVSIVHWRCTGISEEFSASVYGSVSLPEPTDETDYISYADLTEEQVKSWVFANGIDEQATIDNIATQIESQKTPALVKKELPW